MMSAFAYTVIATLPDEQTAREYVRWLQDGHIDGVIEGGAHAAMIVRIEDPAGSIRVETRYTFSTRAAFDRYEAGPAQSLRDEGRALWPPRGVTFERTMGQIL